MLDKRNYNQNLIYIYIIFFVTYIVIVYSDVTISIKHRLHSQHHNSRCGQ